MQVRRLVSVEDDASAERWALMAPGRKAPVLGPMGPPGSGAQGSRNPECTLRGMERNFCSADPQQRTGCAVHGAVTATAQGTLCQQAIRVDLPGAPSLKTRVFPPGDRATPKLEQLAPAGARYWGT